MKEKIKGIKATVLELLENEEECRNDDKHLIWRFWEKESKTTKYANQADLIYRMNFMEATNPANIIRVRALIQNDADLNIEDRYLPTDEKVAMKRGIAREDWEEYLYKSKQGVLF